jgi:NAD(P)H dehydrogenase (quinone)
MKINISIAYHSGYGHTVKVASAIRDGAASIKNADVKLINVAEIDDKGWESLDNSHAIIFGCPTYMGGVSAKYKEFMELSSGRWMKQAWKDKIGAGFTNSGSYSGDKLASLFQLSLNAMQHGMIWVGNAMMPASAKGVEGPDSSQLNRVGSWLGVATQSNHESPEISPPEGDLQTAKIFGERVAKITEMFVSN